MKAVVTRGLEDSSVEEVPTPSPDAGEVLLEIKQVQLSVTECWSWTGDLPLSPELEERMEDDGAIAFGHEFCGEVVELGEGVTQFEVGDRVYGAGKIPCNDCAYCNKGWDFLCKNKSTIGLDRYDGAVAEYMAVPTHPLAKVPDNVSNAEAAAMQPLADSLLTVHDADIETGDTVAVVGGGVMGNQCAQLSQYFGAGEVIVADIDPEKIELAEEMGLTGINSAEVDPVEKVNELTDGIGADVVFAAVGGNQDHATDGNGPKAQAFQMARTGGTIVQVGILSGEMKMDPWKMRMKSVKVINPISSKGVLKTSPNMDTGQLTAQMVSDGRVSIDQFTTVEFEGLESFEDMVEVTLNKEEYDTLGPAQIKVSD